MIELRFHQELYNGFAIDTAVKAYEEFVNAEVERRDHEYIVRLTASSQAIEQGIDETTASLELMNYALGKTIERYRSTDDSPSVHQP